MHSNLEFGEEQNHIPNSETGILVFLFEVLFEHTEEVTEFGANVLEEGELFSVTTGIFTQGFRISYLADGGNDLALTAVPEPAEATS